MGQPKLGGELRALAREAAKDLHATLNQVYSGQPSGPSEPGTPLAPTQYMVNDQVMGAEFAGREPAPGKQSVAEIIAAGKDRAAGPEKEQARGQEMER